MIFYKIIVTLQRVKALKSDYYNYLRISKK